MGAKLLGIALGLLVLSVVFGVLERRWPAIRGQRRWRRGVTTDIAWFFFDPLVSKTLSLAAVVVALIGVAALWGAPLDRAHLRAFVRRESFLSAQPAWLQGVEVLVLVDLIGYWSHRAFHRRPALWRYHAVHHSSTELDWLSSVRVHPVNEIGNRLMQAVPLLVIGFNPGIVAGFVPVFTLYAILLHANVPWSFGPLRRVIASPAFHRWHHTSEQEGLDRNFAALFPWLDILFGTFYMPEGRQPVAFGVLGEDVPDGLVQQLVFPFRRRSSRATPAES